MTDKAASAVHIKVTPLHAGFFIGTIYESTGNSIATENSASGAEEISRAV